MHYIHWNLHVNSINMKLAFKFLVVMMNIMYLSFGRENGICSITAGILECCAMFQEVDGKCLACPNGTYRYEQPHCVNCQEGQYGYRCANKCKCELHERCDKVHGCMCDAGLDTLCLPAPPFAPELTTGETPQNEIEKESVGHPVNYWLIVGVPCGIVVIAATVISFILITIFKIRRTRNEETPVNDSRSDRHTTDACHIYDYVDETMMVDIRMPVAEDMTQMVDDKTRNNGSEVVCSGEDNSGYLNPYTPLTEDWKQHTHTYNDNNELDLDKVKDGYLNPYQPLTEEWKKYTHVYEQSSNSLIHADESNEDIRVLDPGKDVDDKPECDESS